MSAPPQTRHVHIVRRIAPGKALYTDARFITPEELRAEWRAEQRHQQQGERQRAQWQAYHAQRKGAGT